MSKEQVCSLRQAIELNSWGMTEESYFDWILAVDEDGQENWRVVPAYDLKKYTFDKGGVYYAYSIAELIKMLKQIKTHNLSIHKFSDGIVRNEACLSPLDSTKHLTHFVRTLFQDKPKSVEAELLIYALHQKLINPDELKL